ncbi:unnamed protein product, partial [Rotaria sp. Silwood1]
MSPVEQLEELGSCSANAVAGVLEYLIKRKYNIDMDVSRLFIYYNARRIDYQHSSFGDSGATLTGGVRAVRKYGVCDEKIWPYDIKLVNKRPGSYAYRAARRYTARPMTSMQTRESRYYPIDAAQSVPPRSLRFSSGPLPHKIDLRPWMSQIEQQGDIGSCANALAGVLEYLIKRKYNIDMDVSRLFIYYNSRRIDFQHSILTDTGATLTTSAKAVRKYGACDEKLWPYDISLVNKRPTPNAYRAAHRFTSRPVKIPINLPSIKTSLANGLPIAISIILRNSAGEQQMTALDYCRWMLTKLNLAITALEPVLVNLGISTEIADSYLKTFEIPSPEDIHITAQEPLKILSNLFQMSINILPSFRQINNVDDFNNTIPIGQELNETPERTIGAPSEQNECHFNGEIQAIISSNLPRFFNSKDTCLTISLSELLLQAQKYVQEIELAELKIYEQPQEFWKKRSINCLKNKWCPAIHGRSGKQRHYIGIKWSKFIDSNPNNLFVFVQLLSYDNQSHLSKVLVPPETTVKQIKSSEKKQQRNNRRQTLSDLIIKDIYGFDKTTNTILCPITEDEYRRCQKNLKVLMFSLYKTSEEIENLNSIQDLNDNQTVNKDEDNEIFADEDEDSSMENQLLKLCKLRIRLCRRTDENTLEYISNFIDTEWIEE